MSDTTTEQNLPLISTEKISKLFTARPGIRGTGKTRYVRAVDEISMRIDHGEIVGLVGESGCGKSTLGRLLVLLEPPTAGAAFLNGKQITDARFWQLGPIRQQVQMIFQDPQSSLDPLFTVRDTLHEAIRAHRHKVNTRQMNAYVEALMSMVGLDNELLDHYPQELAAGICQRVAIARALAVEPRFLVADEPLSALDLSTQAQIVHLLATVRKELGVSILLISHDLEVIRHLTDRVLVMYLGRIIEEAPTEELMSRALHPYTMALTSALGPRESEDDVHQTILLGEPPSPMDPPSGCHFHPRCPFAEEKCKLIEPKLRSVGDRRKVKCHFDID